MTDTETTTTETTAAAPTPTTARQVSGATGALRARVNNIEREQAAVISTGSKAGRIVAYQWYRRGERDNEYTRTVSPDLPHGPPLLHREGGSLLYDEMKAWHEAQPNAPALRVVERTVPNGKPTYDYGLKLQNNSVEVDSGQNPVGDLDMRQLHDRRELIGKYVSAEFSNANFGTMDAIIRSSTLDADERDHRSAIWFALAENWLCAAAHVGNSVTGDVDALLRGVTRWRYEDYYQHIHRDDVDSSTTVRNVRLGACFHYLEYDDNGDLRLRSTNTVGLSTNFCRWWARNIIYRVPPPYHPLHNY